MSCLQPMGFVLGTVCLASCNLLALSLHRSNRHMVTFDQDLLRSGPCLNFVS